MWKPEDVMVLVLMIFLLGGPIVITLALIFEEALTKLIDKWIERKTNNDKRRD